MRLLPLALVFVGTAAGEARAESLTDRSALVVTFDRLVGYTTETFGREYDSDRATHNFGVGAMLGPRIGMHALFAGGFTVGGVLGAMAIRERDRLRITVAIAGPRIGYWISGSTAGVWPQLGFTTLVATTSRDVNVSWSMHLPFTLRLTTHAGLIVGPSLDMPTSKELGQYTSIGFTAGLFGAF